MAPRLGRLARGIGYAAAMVSLGLAVLCLRQGRAAEVRRLADEMLPILEAHNAPPPAG